MGTGEEGGKLTRRGVFLITLTTETPLLESCVSNRSRRPKTLEAADGYYVRRDKKVDVRL